VDWAGEMMMTTAHFHFLFITVILLAVIECSVTSPSEGVVEKRRVSVERLKSWAGSDETSVVNIAIEVRPHVLHVYAMCYMLYATCYMLYAICYMLYAICYMLYAICYMLYAICYMLYAICYILYTIYYMLYAICYMLYAICYMLYAICYELHCMYWR
jgi:hypothetical protein